MMTPLGNRIINGSDDIRNYDLLENAPIQIKNESLVIPNIEIELNDSLEPVCIGRDKPVFNGKNIWAGISGYSSLLDESRAETITFAGKTLTRFNSTNVAKDEINPDEDIALRTNGWACDDTVIYKRDGNWVFATEDSSLTSASDIEFSLSTFVIHPEYKHYFFDREDIINDSENGITTTWSGNKINTELDLLDSKKVNIKEGWGLSQRNFTATYEQILSSMQSGGLGINDTTASSSTAYSSEKVDTIIKTNITDRLGMPNGFATLSEDGVVSANQLPSYVDDIIEGHFNTIEEEAYNNLSDEDKAAFKVETLYDESNEPVKIFVSLSDFIPDDTEGADPAVNRVNQPGKIYVDTRTRKTYRWSGTRYTVISESLAIGTTASSAYAGNLGTALRNEFDVQSKKSDDEDQFTKNVVYGYGAENAAIRSGSRTYTEEENLAHAGGRKPYPVQAQINDVLKASVQDGKYLKEFDTVSVSDGDLANQIGQYDKIVPVYGDLETDVIASSTSLVAPTTKAVHEFVSNNTSGINVEDETKDGEYISAVSQSASKINVTHTAFDSEVISTSNNAPSSKAVTNFVTNCIQSLDGTVNADTGMFVTNVTETDGKITGSTQSFVTAVAGNESSLIAPTTQAVATHVDNVIDSLDVDAVSPGASGYISSIEETNGKISAASTGFITDISKSDTSVTAPMTCAVKNYVETKINGTVTNLTSAGCNMGDSGYISSISQTDGKISVGTVKFISSLTGDEMQCVPPTSAAVTTFVRNKISGISYNSSNTMSGYIYNITQADGKITPQYSLFANSITRAEGAAPSANAVYNYAVCCISMTKADSSNTDKISWAIGSNPGNACISKASTSVFGAVKIGTNISGGGDAAISVCPIRINYGSSGTAGSSCIAPGGEFTLHCIARDGVTVNTNGSGNAVTSISISGGKDITVCKGTSFAKAYNNENCVQYADKASAYSGGGVGSSTRGIYIDSATCKPRAMDHYLEQDITSNTLLFTDLGTGLVCRYGALNLNLATAVSCDSELPVTAKAVFNFVNQQIKSALK